MNKKEACHKLAEINERIYEIENGLNKIDINICSCKTGDREWYLEKKEELLNELEQRKKEHDDFIYKYSGIIYS